MALVAGVWIWDLRPTDTLTLSFVTKPTDSISANESAIGNIEQPVSEQTNVFDELPLPSPESDEILIQDDAFGFVTGVLKTIYITDERYIVKHDS